MSIKFSAGDDTPALLAATETFLNDAMKDITAAIAAVRQGEFCEAKATAVAVRDLKQAFYGLMEERSRVEKRLREVGGDVGAGRLDLDAARDEIGRRLACLRDAGAG